MNYKELIWLIFSSSFLVTWLYFGFYAITGINNWYIVLVMYGSFITGYLIPKWNDKNLQEAKE